MNGNTELHLAALLGNTDKVQQLLDQGHSTVEQNAFGKLAEEVSKTPQLRYLLVERRKQEVQQLLAEVRHLRLETAAQKAENEKLSQTLEKQLTRQGHLLRALEELEPITAIDFRSTKPIPKPNPKVVNTSGKSGSSSGSKSSNTEATEKKAEKQKATKKQPKKPKQKGQAKSGGNATAPANPITELDIRVGEIIDAWEHPDSEKLWCESIKCGDAEPRQILSGLRHNFSKEEMLRKVLVVCNLKAAKLGGIPSHGMVLCASNEDHTSVEFLTPPEQAQIGERVSFEGLDNVKPAGQSRVHKKKIFQKAAVELATTADCIAAWDGHKMMTSAGAVTVSSLANVPIK